MQNYVILLLNLSLAVSLNAADYYVATDGDDTNPGTLVSPFKTVQMGVDQLSAAGDNLYIRGGTYSDTATINNKIGASGNPITIQNYNNETVTFDGTVPVLGTWSLHSGNIYKIVIPQDVHQLFVEERMQVIARWPNATTHPVDTIQRQPNTYIAVDDTWWSKTSWGLADLPGTDGPSGTIENNPASYDLAATGLSFQGGSVILTLLEQSKGNFERNINTHVAGTNILTHDSIMPLDVKAKGYYFAPTFIIEHLNALDQAEEWYYTPADNTLYLWADDGNDPTGRAVRGRTMTYAFSIYSSSYITIKGIDFFACTLDAPAGTSTDLRLEDTDLLYPSASKRILGEYPYDPQNDMEITHWTGTNAAIVNASIKYAMGNPLDMDVGGSNDGHLIENCNFSYNMLYGVGSTGHVMGVGKVVRSTFHILGSRAGMKTNTGPEANRLHMYNYIDGYAYQQVQHDGSFFQANENNATGTIRAYNWFFFGRTQGSRSNMRRQ